MHKHMKDAEYGRDQIIRSKILRGIGTVLAGFALLFVAMGAAAGDKEYDTIQNIYWARWQQPGFDTADGPSSSQQLYFGNYKIAVETADAKNDLKNTVETTVEYDGCNRTYETKLGVTSPLIKMKPMTCGLCDASMDDMEAPFIISIFIHLVGFPLNIMHMSESMNSQGNKIAIALWYFIGFVCALTQMVYFKDCYDYIDDNEGDLKYGPAFVFCVITMALDLLLLPFVVFAQTAPIPTMQSVPCTPLFWYNACCWNPPVVGRADPATAEKDKMVVTDM
jgi:hypothetical protein